MTGDRLTGGAATVVLSVVAGSALTADSTRTYALARATAWTGRLPCWWRRAWAG